MGKEWDVDDILDRALQEEDPQRMDAVIARLVAEERMSRAAMLRRSAAAGIGLTILSSPAAAFARSSGALAAAPPLRGGSIPFATILKEAKREGASTRSRCRPTGRTTARSCRPSGDGTACALTNDNPDASSAQENQAVRSLKGDPRAPDVLDVGPSFAIEGANEGLYAKYFNRYFGTVPRAMKDGRGFWVGDYWGVVSFGVNRAVVSNVPKTWADLLKPEYKNRVALNGSPLSSGSAVAGVFSAAIAQRRLAQRHRAGDRLLQEAEGRRQLHPGAGDAADDRVGPDPDRDRLGLPEPRLHQGVPERANRGLDSDRRRLRRALLPGDQRHRPASVGGAGSGRSSSTRTPGQLLWLKGYSHPARFADMARRKVIPAALVERAAGRRPRTPR